MFDSYLGGTPDWLWYKKPPLKHVPPPSSVIGLINVFLAVVLEVALVWAMECNKSHLPGEVLTKTFCHMAPTMSSLSRTDKIMLQMFRFKFISVDENDWHLFLKGEGQAMKGARRSINTRNPFTVQVAWTKPTYWDTEIAPIVLLTKPNPQQRNQGDEK